MSRSALSSVAVLLFTLSVWHVSLARSMPEGSGSKVEVIVADETLFPGEFAAKVDWKGMQATSRWKLWTAVPETQRPMLAAILEKYGKQQSTVDEIAPALSAGSIESMDSDPPKGVPTRKVKVYYYDHVGLAVDGDEHDPRVLLITNRPAPKQP